MNKVPVNPKIYHITHVDNLPSIVAEGGLWSDAQMLKRGNPVAMIGMSKLKQRRLEELKIDCLDGIMVGECVPFYFCPRSVMLFLIHRRNSEVTFKGGQESIVHLEADLHRVLEWAHAEKVPWAFSLSNAASYYAQFRADVAQLDEIDWEAVVACNWQGRQDKKAAEFLMQDFFPFKLVDKIGVATNATALVVAAALCSSAHQPAINRNTNWYY